MTDIDGMTGIDYSELAANSNVCESQVNCQTGFV